MNHGDVRAWATEVFHKGLESIINAKSLHDRPYYILVQVLDGYQGRASKNVHDDLESGIMQEKEVDLSKKKVATNRFTLLNQPPPVPLLDSSLWFVNNRTGQVKCCYILPPDKPMITNFEIGGESELVFNCGQNMPIVN